MDESSSWWSSFDLTAAAATTRNEINTHKRIWTNLFNIIWNLQKLNGLLQRLNVFLLSFHVHINTTMFVAFKWIDCISEKINFNDFYFAFILFFPFKLDLNQRRNSIIIQSMTNNYRNEKKNMLKAYDKVR